jgi:hypothetical protein
MHDAPRSHGQGMATRRNTASGSVYASFDEGDSWQEIARHLPTILSLEILDRGKGPLIAQSAFAAKAGESHSSKRSGAAALPGRT